jgi:hypothetical protein
MRALSIMSFVVLGLCAGCADQNGASVAQTGTCAHPSVQVSLVPLPCQRTSGWPSGLVITNPDGGGPQVELWGPPVWANGAGG